MSKNDIVTRVMQTGAALVGRVRDLFGPSTACNHRDPDPDCGTCRARMFRRGEASGQVSYGDRDAHPTDF